MTTMMRMTMMTRRVRFTIIGERKGAGEGALAKAKTKGAKVAKAADPEAVTERSRETQTLTAFTAKMMIFQNVKHITQAT